LSRAALETTWSVFENPVWVVVVFVLVVVPCFSGIKDEDDSFPRGFLIRSFVLQYPRILAR
jgi:hypothetical protein